MVVETILPAEYVSILIGIFIIIVGIFAERKLKVTWVTILVNIGNLAAVVFFTNTNSPSYPMFLILFSVGIALVIEDIKRGREGYLVAFVFGSKTIGSVTLFAGLLDNNMTGKFFTPIANYVADSAKLQSTTATDPFFINFVAIATIIIAVWVVGGIVALIFHLLGKD